MIFLPTPGALVANRFRLRHPIGKGGMGQVWEAHDRELDSACAIKFILDHLARDPDARSRLVREARAVARLRSPHVVTILGVGEHADAIYLAMELLEGETLASRMDRTRRLDPTTTLVIVDQVVQVLDKAHAHGIVHRDLKPDNIWLSADSPPFIKVLDFGVAKSTLKTGEKHTATGALMGTPHYMSPEQAAGDREVDHRSDLWALAVIAMECLSGRRPFESSGLGDLLMKIMQSKPPLAQELDPTLPPALNLWWQQALARDLEQRFQTASDLALGLRIALGISAAPAAGASPFAETSRGTWGVAPVPRTPTLVTNITPAPLTTPKPELGEAEPMPPTVVQPLEVEPAVPGAALRTPSLVDSTQVAEAPPPLTEPMTVPPQPAASFPFRAPDAGSVGALAKTAHGRSRSGPRRWPFVAAGTGLGLALLAMTWWRLREPELDLPARRASSAQPVKTAGQPAPLAEALPSERAVAHSLRPGGAAGAAGVAPVEVQQPRPPAVTVKPVPAAATPPASAAPSIAPVRVAPVIAQPTEPQPAAQRANPKLAAPSIAPKRAAPKPAAPKPAASRPAAPKPAAATEPRRTELPSAPPAKPAPAKATPPKPAVPAKSSPPASESTPGAAELQRRLGF